MGVQTSLCIHKMLSSAPVPYVNYHFLARLNEVQEELLHFPGRQRWRQRRCQRWQNVKKIYVKVFCDGQGADKVLGKVLTGELSCPFDRSF